MRLGTIVRVWKRIDLIEGMKKYKGYEVSSCGEIRSLYYKGYIGSKILKPRVNSKYGYLFVGLGANGKSFYIHRLVSLAFIPNDNNFIEIDHINSDKTNNSVNNLQWITREDNVRKANGKKVFCVELNKIFPSTIEVERQLGLEQSSISRCCRSKRKTCGGYHWYYINTFLL